MGLTKNRQEEIIKAVQRGLEWQFESYSWDNMIEDCLLSNKFSQKDIEWAKQNISYKAYKKRRLIYA